MPPSSDILEALKQGSELELDMLLQMREGLPSLLDDLIAEARKHNAAIQELEGELSADKHTSCRLGIETAQHIVNTLNKVAHAFHEEVDEIGSDITDSYDRYPTASDHVQAEYRRHTNDANSALEDANLLEEATEILEEATDLLERRDRNWDTIDRIEKLKVRLIDVAIIKYEKHEKRLKMDRLRDLALGKAAERSLKEIKALMRWMKRLGDSLKLVKGLLRLLESDSA